MHGCDRQSGHSGWRCDMLLSSSEIFLIGVVLCWVRECQSVKQKRTGHIVPKKASAVDAIRYGSIFQVLN